MTPRDARSESGRRLGHMTFGLPAFALVWLDWRVALGIALYALFVNAEVLPRTRLGRRWLRPGEGLTGGIVTYPLTVALLILIFRDDTLPAAAGWVTMAFGDPAAAWIGRSWPGRPLPWHPAKSAGGTAAFFAAALIAVVFVHAQHRGLEPVSLLFAACVAATGAALESLRLPVNDNLAVGLGAAAVAFLLGTA